MNDETLSAKPNDEDLTLRPYLDQSEEAMDLETARELLHDMVRKEYASLWTTVSKSYHMANTDKWYFAYICNGNTVTIVDARYA